MTNTIDWLLKGDPSILWQVMRDLLEEPPEIDEKEWAKVKVQGWGAANIEIVQVEFTSIL